MNCFYYPHKLQKADMMFPLSDNGERHFDHDLDQDYCFFHKVPLGCGCALSCTESRAGPWNIGSHAECYDNQSINSKKELLVLK